MNALTFIILKSIKNSLKELKKNPGKLVLYAFVILLLVFIIIMSFININYMETITPIFILNGVIFLFITLFSVLSVSKGLSGGDTIFGMNDVNFLFVSPVSSRKILFYGIIRMAKTAFLAGFFILFQSALFNSFGFGYGGVLVTFAGFILSVIVLTIISILIYSVTNGKALRKRFVKIITAAFFLPVIIFLVIKYFETQNIITSLELAVNSSFLSFVPVAGWTAKGVVYFLTGEILKGTFFFGLNILLGTVITVYIILSNPDYYEDVLVATETAYEKLRTISEGNVNAATVTNRKIKVSKTGIPGTGAVSIFGKHMRESFRESRFGFLSLVSVFFIIGAAVASFFVSDLLIIMMVLMWTQILLIGTGRGLKETYSHYIYMIPQSSFSKIIWSNMEVFVKTLAESILIFGISGIIIKGMNPAHVLVFILVYTLFSFLLLGVNYFFMRFTKADLTGGLLILIYYIAVMLIMAPGIILAFLSGNFIDSYSAVSGTNAGLYTGLLVLSLWELLAGLFLFTFSKGVLHNCDIQIMKTNK